MSTTKALENISTVLSAGVLPEPHSDRRKQAPNDTFKIRSAATSWRSLHRGLYIGECLLPLPHKLAKISTEASLWRWKSYRGFRVTCQSSQRKMHSAEERSQVVHEYLQTEISARIIWVHLTQPNTPRFTPVVSE